MAIQLRGFNAASWSGSEVLAPRQVGLELDTGKFKVGDGTTAWSSLGYFGSSGSGTVTSVGLSVPSGFSVSGSPITTNGTLSITTTLNGWLKGNGSGFTAVATVPTTDLSGTMLAAQFPALSGPITTTAGSLTTSIGAGVVTLSNISDIAANSILGNNTGSAATPLALTAAQVRTLINVADGATANVGTVTSVSGAGTVNGLTLTGSVTGSGSLTLGGTLSISGSDFGSQSQNRFLASPDGASGNPTFRKITLADFPNIAANSLLGNNTGALGPALALTATQVTALLDTATTSLNGLMSSSDKSKLDGIASGATANATDAALRDRATHTGTQAAATITGLATVATSGSAADLTGNLPVARLNSGTGATSSTFWRGDGTWAATAPSVDPTAAPWGVDDFLTGSNETGEIGVLGWSFTNGTITAANSVQNHPGLIRRANGTTANQIASLYLGNSAAQVSFRFDEFDEQTWIFREFAAGVTDLTVRIGMFADVAGNPSSHGVYLELLPADSNWFFVSRSASVQTRVDSGVAARTTGWIKIKIRRIDASTVGFSINGGSEVTITSNIPPSSQLLHFGQMQVASGTTARSLDFDFFSFRLLPITR